MTPLPKLSHVEMSPRIKALVDTAKSLYQTRLAYFAQTHKPPAYVCAAPGRVNLIGEHVDYQNGFVLPFALDDYATVVYGTGFLHTGKSSAKTMVRIRLCSDMADVPEMIEERRWSGNDIRPPTKDDERHWVNYIVGVIIQYMPDIPQEGCVLDLAMAYSSNVPLGSGLSSSAALEVGTWYITTTLLLFIGFVSGCLRRLVVSFSHTGSSLKLLLSSLVHSHGDFCRMLFARRHGLFERQGQ
jgi:galactokinase